MHPELPTLFCAARGLLHIDWYDWCPNLVVESIAHSCPVLCGSVVGTPEIVRACGLSFDFGDPEPDFHLPPFVPPPIRQSFFNLALKEFLDFDFPASFSHREDLMISKVAQHYIMFASSISSW